MSCLFCKLVKGEIPCQKVLENETILAFKDINPVAPIHILIVPKKHLNNILGFDQNDDKLLLEVFMAIKKIAQENSLENGFRLIANTGPDGGQTVEHLHFHLLGGRKFHWPPG